MYFCLKHCSRVKLGGGYAEEGVWFWLDLVVFCFGFLSPDSLHMELLMSD